MLKIAKDLFDLLYPIGTYYETSNPDWTPSSAGWYGTWNREDDGTTLVSYKSSGVFNKTIGTIVGEETHKLTSSELPNVVFDVAHICYGEHTDYAVKNITVNKNGGNEQSYGGGWEGSASSGIGIRRAHRYSFGNDGTHNIVQPSKISYRWHRTA